MKFDLTIITSTPDELWIEEFQAVLMNLGIKTMQIHVQTDLSREPVGQILFIDARLASLETFLKNIHRKGKAVFLIIEENVTLPATVFDAADDVLLRPFRRLEALGKLKHYQHILMWDEVAKLNESFSELLGRLDEDLHLAERLQKARVPAPLSNIKGFKVRSRYLAGARAGGDYFDVLESAQSRAGNGFISILLSDSSSYGLSSTVLSVLMKVAMKLSAEQTRSSTETVGCIYKELIATLNKDDRLSMFYGVLSRKDLILRYVNMGTTSVFHAKKDHEFNEIPTQAAPLTANSGFNINAEAELSLNADDRLVIISDGVTEALGGKEPVRMVLNQSRSKDTADVVNELIFNVKSKLSEPDVSPAQDCTAIVFDVDARTLKVV